MAVVRAMRGFTLVELVISVAFLLLLVAAATPAYREFTAKYQLDANARDLEQLLRTAQNLSMATRDDDTYGVHLTGGSFTLFKGASYAARDSATFGEISYALPGSISLSETVVGDDVVFGKVDGTTDDVGTVTLTGRSGTRTITVNEAGLVTFD